MKKRIFALVSSIALFFTLNPIALADKYKNEAFVGKYLSAGATDSNYGELNILTCDSDSITVNFKFVKNNNQQLVYTCYEGTMSDTKGTIPFTVSYTDGRYVANGTMSITLSDYSVKVLCDSPTQHLFDGTMMPQFVLNPRGTASNNSQSNVSTSSDVSVVLNGEKMSFPEGINPIIINDSTYVPLRSVFDKMGINVFWDHYKLNSILDAQSITCTKNDTIVQFRRTFNETGSNVWTLTKWIGENTDSSNFTRINITDLQPTIINNSSYIPLRVVSEAFGADVGWLHEERTVEINCDVTNSYNYDNELIGKIEDFSQEIATSFITDDFHEVKASSTPYFSPQAKFYKYTAHDTWNDVELRVFYGGFLEVTPIVPEEETPIIPETDITEETTEEVTDNTTEDVVENTTEDVVEDATEDVVENTTEDVTEESENTTEEVVSDDTVSEDVSNETTEDAPTDDKA